MLLARRREHLTGEPQKFCLSPRSGSAGCSIRGFAPLLLSPDAPYDADPGPGTSGVWSLESGDAEKLGDRFRGFDLTSPRAPTRRRLLSLSANCRNCIHRHFIPKRQLDCESDSGMPAHARLHYTTPNVPHPKSGRRALVFRHSPTNARAAVALHEHWLAEKTSGSGFSSPKAHKSSR